MINYVLGFMFSEDLEKVVLIRKDHPAEQKDLLNGVGGRIMANESELRAMVRETLEECGVKTYEADWHFVGSIMIFADDEANHTPEPKQDVKILIYCCMKDISEAKTTSREAIEIHTVKKLPPTGMVARAGNAIDMCYAKLFLILKTKKPKEDGTQEG